MAANNSQEQIRDFLGADSLGYLSLESMIASTGLPAKEFCTACYTGQYPSPVESEMDKFVMEQRRTHRHRPISDLVQNEVQRPLL